MNLLLTASGFQQPHIYAAFLSMLEREPPGCSVAIITTASAEWKERNKHAVATKELLDHDGFSRVEYVDVEHEDAGLLRDFDAVFINGGNPFYLLHHLDESGARQVLCELAEKQVAIVGSSAGAMVLGPDLSVAAWFTPEMNTLGMTNLSALNLVPVTLYPHYGRRVDDEANICVYEGSCNRTVVRLPDSQALLIQGGPPVLVSLDEPSG